jgi:hypothetical protein
MKPRRRLAAWALWLAALALWIAAALIDLALCAPAEQRAAERRLAVVELTGLPGLWLSTGAAGLRHRGLADASWRAGAHPELPGVLAGEGILAPPERR